MWLVQIDRYCRYKIYMDLKDFIGRKNYKSPLNILSVFVLCQIVVK
jgi:hypothetical protein